MKAQGKVSVTLLLMLTRIRAVLRVAVETLHRPRRPHGSAPEAQVAGRITAVVCVCLIRKGHQDLDTTTHAF